jgi:hypothetical protein
MPAVASMKFPIEPADQAAADHGNKHEWNEQEKADLVTRSLL